MTQNGSSTTELVGIGYTIATGHLYAPMSAVHRYAEGLLGRPILIHEFADPAIWAALRAVLEGRATAEMMA